MTLELAKRPEEDNNKNPFNGLKDLDLLRSLASYISELTADHIHFLNQGRFDEN